MACLWSLISGTKYTKEYDMIVKFEFRKICDMILGLMSGNRIIQATSGESKVFYQEMKADHYRYVAGFSDGDAKSKMAE